MWNVHYTISENKSNLIKKLKKICQPAVAIQKA